MNTLVFFFTLIVVIEVVVIGGTALMLRKSDNMVLAVLGEFSTFIVVWWIASTQVDIHDATAFSQMAYYKIIGLIVAIAGLAVIYRRQNQRAHH